MFFPKVLFCRVFQGAFRIALPFLPYREPEIIYSCSKLGSALKKERATSVLIVTDKGVISNGLVEPLENVLNKSGISYCIYDDTSTNPTIDNVEDALKVYKENRCNGIIGIGGGSAMDCAKAVGVRVAYPEKTVLQLCGKLKAWRPLPTLVAIPTTAGTGSEATLAAMVTDSETHKKYAIMSFPLIPHYAVLDASLTYSLPPHLTASTGIDALTHAVEAYIGRSTTKETRKLALEATKLIFENIETAYNEGSNQKARENMLLAAYKAGLAFSMSYVGYVHAIAHSLGGMYGTPHGLANAVLLPYVLKAYRGKVTKKLHELGVAAGVTTNSVPHEEGAVKFKKAIKALNERIGIPNKLEGIKKEDIGILAENAEKEANPLYPVPVLMTKRELEEFYYQVADWSN